MDRGYIALLDVLGFSALVGGGTSSERLSAYLACLETASSSNAVNYVVFSDSIVLTAKGFDDTSFIAVARGCANLLAALLAEGIALRGAITFGEIFRSSVGESVFVAGRAVIAAYEYERQQDWVGVMVAPNAVKQFPDIQDRCKLLERLAWGITWKASRYLATLRPMSSHATAFPSTPNPLSTQTCSTASQSCRRMARWNRRTYAIAFDVTQAAQLAPLDRARSGRTAEIRPDDNLANECPAPLAHHCISPGTALRDTKRGVTLKISLRRAVLSFRCVRQSDIG